eukprot:gene24167-32586_t
MDELSRVSCEEYRTLIEKEDFIAYFRKGTPELELGSLNIGSRPSKRNPKGGIDSLRAIPWTLHLPAWVGVGDALRPQDESDSTSSLSRLREMYERWPFFREMIDLIAMTLSKTDFSISYNYEKQLVEANDSALLTIGDSIRDKLLHTRDSVLKVTGCDDLSNGFKLLQRSMKVRYPYVDPLNVLQAEIMKRLRRINARIESNSVVNPATLNNNSGKSNSIHIPAVDHPDLSLGEEKQLLEDSLVVSINGIAQGMKNSG